MLHRNQAQTKSKERRNREIYSELVLDQSRPSKIPALKRLSKEQAHF